MPHDEISDRTIDLLGLADVERWGVVRTLRPQSVAEHCFAVAVIAVELAERLHIDGSNMGAILTWSIIHDAPETFTGDISGRFKSENPAVSGAVHDAEDDAFPWYAAMRKVASPQVKALIKVADCIEAYAFIRDWGHGARADDVKRELATKIDRSVQSLAAALDVPLEDVYAVTRQVLHHSTSESNCIQMRRHRK